MISIAKKCQECGVESKNFYGRKLTCWPCLSQKRKLKRKLEKGTPQQKERARRENLKHNYGINVEDFNDRLRKQKNKCAICKRLQEPHKNFSVDHNHKTGLIRGLLCSQCNVGLGFLQENKRILKNAISYLEKTNG